MSNTKHTITDSEYTIMKILWESQDKLTVSDVVSKLDGADWTASTVSTFLQRLLKKGVISCDKKGKTNLYYPLLRQEEYDLSGQLCEALLQFEDAWEAKELNIETDIEDDVRICSDGELLSLVWNNLISNAVKFTPRGGTIGVALKADEKQVEVTVSDTGCGMKPEVGQHIFEKFYQGDTSHATQGNGLGLALVKRVVDIFSGEISVQSVYGQGSTFTVRFRR